MRRLGKVSRGVERSAAIDMQETSSACSTASSHDLLLVALVQHVGDEGLEVVEAWTNTSLVPSSGAMNP